MSKKLALQIIANGLGKIIRDINAWQTRNEVEHDEKGYSREAKNQLLMLMDSICQKSLEDDS
tara:strand:- start:2333 stop:2518 length:186 start_codon:yes stop_codon:yes gene_type:complete